MFLGIYGQQRPKSACAFAQPDQGIHYPLRESFDTIECINAKQSKARGEILRIRKMSESADVRRHFFA